MAITNIWQICFAPPKYYYYLMHNNRKFKTLLDATNLLLCSTIKI